MADEHNPGEPFAKKVDEDWKAAMRREREKLQAKQKATEQQTEAQASETDQLFLGFLNQLVGQTMMDLGAMPNPMTGQREVNLEQARQMIDIIRAVDRKSKKSQSKEEQEFFRQILGELQMMYVQVAQAAGQRPGATGSAGGSAPPHPAAGAPGPAGTGGAVPGTGRKRR